MTEPAGEALPAPVTQEEVIGIKWADVEPQARFQRACREAIAKRDARIEELMAELATAQRSRDQFGKALTRALDDTREEHDTVEQLAEHVRTLKQAVRERPLRVEDHVVEFLQAVQGLLDV